MDKRLANWMSLQIQKHVSHVKIVNEIYVAEHSSGFAQIRCTTVIDVWGPPEDTLDSGVCRGMKPRPTLTQSGVCLFILSVHTWCMLHFQIALKSTLAFAVPPAQQVWGSDRSSNRQEMVGNWHFKMKWMHKLHSLWTQIDGAALIRQSFFGCLESSRGHR